MATVRITNELCINVAREIRALYHNRISKLGSIEEADNPEQVQAIYDFLLGEYTERINALPTGFMRMAESATFTTYRSNNPTVGMSCAIRLKFDTPRPVPDVFTNDYVSIETKRYGHEPDITLTYNLKEYKHTALDCVCQHMLKTVEIQKQLQTALDSVKKLLIKYSTLSPALKEFPALWDLLPEETKAKHREVVEKKSKRETVSESTQEVGDLVNINAAIIANKLGA